MKLNPYLVFDGCAEQAFAFYAECLGGELLALMRFEGSPACDDVPADYAQKIMHAALKVGDQVLMASDVLPGQPYEGIKGCSIALAVDDPAEAARVFEALSAGGRATMPLAETFWAVRFGMLVDRYGVAWMVNCARPECP